jgi:hypothetical protein
VSNRMLIASAAFNGYVLSASRTDSSLWLKQFDPWDEYQQWEQQGQDSKFRLVNHGKRKILQFNGGNEQPLVLVEAEKAPGNTGFFSWGGPETWGGRALQSYLDSGQNVDAMSHTAEGQATTAPVLTRGWRHGHQRELTYTKQPILEASGTRAILSAAFNNQALSASSGDRSLWLKPLNVLDEYQQWIQLGADDQFILWNCGKSRILQFSGGNEQPVIFAEPWMASGNSGYFSWGGTESWGGRALQSYLDSGQNVDAMSHTAGDQPTTDPVLTRGWRHGHQRELTWSLMRVDTIPDVRKRQMMEQLAPKVWLADAEEYFPCSVEWSFAYLKRFRNDDDGGRYWLQTIETLKSPSDDSLALFKGVRDLGTVPVYAFWVPKRGFYDITYFTYYGYNRGKEVASTIWG